MITNAKTKTILSEEANESLKDVLSENTSVVCMTSRDERMSRLLLDYPVRSTWENVYDELEEVYNERVRLWSSVGAYEGLIVSSPCVLDKGLCECLVSLPDNILEFFPITVSRDMRKPLKNAGDSWRLSFAAGAIIGASMHNQNLNGGSMACFGYGCEYEGTAGSMAFDPNLAVLEHVKFNPSTNEYERIDGFQFVVLTPYGVHAYGGLYSGSDIDNYKASELAYALGFKLRGNAVTCDYAELNNKALDVMAHLIKKTSDADIDAKSMYVEECDKAKGKPVTKNGACINAYVCLDRDMPWIGQNLIDTNKLWHPMDVQKGYCECTYNGAFWITGCDIVRIYDECDINEMLDVVEIYDEDMYTCEWCDNRYNPEYDGCYSEILDEHFCCWDCMIEALTNRAEQQIDSIILINGTMYDLNNDDL